MAKKICGIYKIENTITKRVYVGSSKEIHQRWWQHKNLLNKDKHHSRKLQEAWNEFGSSNFIFSIIEEVEYDSLFTREQYYMDLLDSYNNGYNASDNAICSLNACATYEDIDSGKFSISRSQFDDIIHYLVNTDIPITVISEITFVNKSSIYQIYYKEHYFNIVKDFKFRRRKMTSEHSRILSEDDVLLIIKMLLEKVYMIDISRKYSVNTSTIWDIYNHKSWRRLTENIQFPSYEKKIRTTGKPVNQFTLDGELIESYKTARDAEKATGIGYKMISRCCKGDRPYTNGFKWEFSA